MFVVQNLSSPPVCVAKVINTLDTDTLSVLSAVTSKLYIKI